MTVMEWVLRTRSLLECAGNNSLPAATSTGLLEQALALLDEVVRDSLVQRARGDAALDMLALSREALFDLAELTKDADGALADAIRERVDTYREEIQRSTGGVQVATTEEIERVDERTPESARRQYLHEVRGDGKPN